VVKGLETERAENDRTLKTQDEGQRDINDCLSYKLSKHSEEELGQNIGQVEAQIGVVSFLHFARHSSVQSVEERIVLSMMELKKELPPILSAIMALSH